MSTHIPPWEPWKSLRKHLRVLLRAEVQCVAADITINGWSENISMGGLFVLADQTLDLGTEVAVRLRFPSGYWLECPGSVARATPGKNMGIQFRDLKEEDRKELSGYIKKQRDPRRSARLLRRLSVMLRWTDLEGQVREESAYTLTLSRYGCLLTCQTRFRLGDNLYIWWPEGHRGVHVRTVYRRLGGHGDATEMGLEFLGDNDFWGMRFPGE
jgi:Tfp pilus assembly protein PilZ